MNSSSPHLSTPEGPGSVSGAPHLPPGFTDTYTPARAVGVVAPPGDSVGLTGGAIVAGILGALQAVPITTVVWTAIKAWAETGRGAGKTHLERFMTTPRDLLMVAMDMESGRPPEQGDVPLRAGRGRGDRSSRCSGHQAGRRAPCRSAGRRQVIGCWMRRRRPLFDSPAHRAAAKRWTSDDAVLAARAAAVSIHGERTVESQAISDDAVATALAAVDAAVMELGLVRQRRAIEGAAIDNVWRGE